mmetsp:Transcript_35925/g.56051  ORF Transcript_35925/g.56051 Transcript_35925/m.56051 type:complete len:82 (+) Transcript_35925:314-559(+)
MKEAFTDSDTYSLDFPPEMPAEEKARLMTSVLLLDYMFFERDSDMIKFENGKLTLVCCNLFCCGCICPCKVQCGGSNNNGE